MKHQEKVADGVEEHAEAVSVSMAARRAGVSRTFLYEALNPATAARVGIPALPSIKAGKRRLVRIEALRGWLKSLETKAA